MSEFEFTSLTTVGHISAYEVKFFHDTKGYGFLKTADGDAIVHYSEIVGQTGHRTLWEGDIVEATIVKGTRGIEARNVRLVAKGPRQKREPLVSSK